MPRFERFCGHQAVDWVCPAIVSRVPPGRGIFCTTGLHPIPPRPGGPIVPFALAAGPADGWRPWGDGGPFNRVRVDLVSFDLTADLRQTIHLANSVGAVLKTVIAGPPILVAWLSSPAALDVVYDGLWVEEGAPGGDAAGQCRPDPGPRLVDRLARQFTGSAPTAMYANDRSILLE